MKRRVYYKHSQPYKKYIVEHKGGDNYLINIFIIINNCWRLSFRRKTNKKGVDSLLCDVKTGIVASTFYG